MDALHDRDAIPDMGTFERAVGESLPLWTSLVDWLRSTYGIEGEPVWSGPDDGWSLRFRRGGKALLTLFLRRGELRAVVVIGPSAWAQVRPDELRAQVRDAWASARPYPDGRWLWLSVRDQPVVADICRLIALKSPPPRHPRPGRTAGTATRG